ncbi:MAG TPA: nucleoside triphosphate pyrophosphatase [Candidatus Saccharimonadales bacterium]|nr:nucleoside triphosphate pyrophosphatase [Candidatus Saccharimonadales bacterium]
MKVILASQSPRRRQLLQLMGLDFEQIPSAYEEKLDDSRKPEDVAVELAIGKAGKVAADHPEALVIGSDTIVTVAGKQLEKPKDKNDAYRLLKLLSGRPNVVTSSVAVIRLSDNTKLLAADSAKVFFKPFNEEIIKAYIATGDPMDKAGAYGIQSGAAPLISHIEGRYDTILGLPTKALSYFLQTLGIDSTAVELVSPVKNIADL